MVTYQDHLDQDHIVFPLYPIVEGKCGCYNKECRAAGKHPLTNKWQLTKKYSEAELSRLENREGIFGENKLQNYGILLPKSKLLVVDVDGRNGGFESAKSLQHIRNECQYIVVTGSGNGEHWYFNYEGCKKLSTNLKDFPGIDFKSTGFVVGAGSGHVSGNRYHAANGDPSKITEAPAELIELLAKPDFTRFHLEDYGEIDLEELTSLVDAIPNPTKDYERFITIGMALHHTTGGSAEGFALWERWCDRCDGAITGKTRAPKWDSFGGEKKELVKAGTLVYLAKQHGWLPPVEFSPTVEFNEPQEQPQLPGVDLMKPPGIVGELVEWIKCRQIYPRDQLAVAAALYVVSCAAALRYRVAPLNTSVNLMVVGVAGSGTGKGAIKGSIDELMSVIGLNRVTHGEFKSTQATVRDFINHQAGYFVLDEIGGFLKKLTSKEVYLTDLAARIISIFTEANGRHRLSGDLSREIIKEKTKELENAEKLGKTEEEKAEIKKRIHEAENGIINPTLGFFGVSEPYGFYDALEGSQELLTGGFLSRALIFTEANNAPRINTHCTPNEPLPLPLKMRLTNIYNDGNAEEFKRIELRGEIQQITIDSEAEELRERVIEYWHERAEQEIRQGSRAESLCQRGQEITMKVAGILAVEARVITKTEMLWAHVLVRKILEEKINRAKAHDGVESKSATERGDGFVLAFYNALKNAGEPCTAAFLRNTSFRNKMTKEDAIKYADKLVEAGFAESFEKTSANNRITTYYQLIPK